MKQSCLSVEIYCPTFWIDYWWWWCKYKIKFGKQQLYVIDVSSSRSGACEKRAYTYDRLKIPNAPPNSPTHLLHLLPLRSLFVLIDMIDTLDTRAIVH